jgi:histidyl-tRNA synthetase
MNDLLPDAVERWQRIEAVARDILHAYGYREIRLPILEKSELFARSIGSLTDIVEKEMYSFEDRSGENLTLRPEGTAGCVRAGIENGFLHNQIQRLWYAGPMFRHERPQKGRYRQFHQIGVEAFGIETPDLDVELIFMCARLWRALGLDGISLQLNSLGTPASRAAYRRELVSYLEARRDRLDEDSLRRLDKNPLRILDSKNPAMQDVIAAAPSLSDHLDDASRAHFERLGDGLRQARVDFTINPRLVRGLDYYTRTVFEWTTERLGAQSAVCAGGRYDGLVEQLGGKPTPAAGFAIGMERLAELLAQRGDKHHDIHPQAYLVLLGEGAERQGPALAERLRDAGLRIECNCGGGSLKTQLKRADRSGARHALLLGEDEVRSASVTMKDLRDGAQRSIAQSELIDLFLKTIVKET